MDVSWDTLQADWTAVQAGWNQAWRDAQAKAIAAWDGTMQEAQDLVHDFLDDLQVIDEDLDWMEAQLPTLPPATAAAWSPWIVETRKTWSWLGAGIYPYVTAGEPTGVQGAPVALIVVGVAGVAFAAAFWEYAAYLRDDVALRRSELEAIVDASKDGRTLQPSPLERTDPKATKGGIGVTEVLVGAGLLAGFGLGLAWAIRR